MLNPQAAFSGFSVDNLDKAMEFYGNILGLDIKKDEMGLSLHVGAGNPIFIYEKPDHAPASFTILNFPVEDIDKVVEELKGKGIKFESYPEMTDEDGIARGKQHNMGPDIAWFKDPAGNVLSVLSN